ncbi:MAG: hypothetical protein L3J41_06755 [Melioribacteraceae bacterium]|nr:hypothetical protein [Melioribacteraceae bacterium]
MIAATSCSDEVIPETPKYERGVLVVNQGNFGSGTGTLTHKENGSENVTQNIFTGANNGAFLGNIAQSMIEHDGKNYISINNGGKVVVTNNVDFTLLDTIGGIDQSRYFASNGDKLYLSAWGDTGSNGGVYEINTASNSVANFLDIGSGPEGLIFANEMLYIANGGGFGTDSLVLILDPSDNSIVKSLVVGDKPQLMVKDNDDNVYVICNGKSDWMDPSQNTSGKLVKITNQEIAWTIDIPNGSKNLTIDAENEFLYFVTEGKVVKQDMNSMILQTKAIKEIDAYALGFDHDEKILYLSDAKGFMGQGQAYMYSTNDVEIDSFATGIGPGYFHFQ